MPTLQPESYADVGKIVRELTDMFPRASPPQVTPLALRELVAYLERVTASVQRHLLNTGEAFEIDGITGEPREKLTRLQADLTAWSLRLALYKASTDGCPPQDVQCTLWTVIAPLFFGIFDGEKGIDPQKAADLSTPFIIGNQASELRAWSEDQLGWSAGYRDIVTSISDLPDTLDDAGAAGLRALGWIADSIRSTASAVIGIEWSTIAMLAGGAGIAYLWLRSRK